jgi:DNA-binding transcriptional regulator YiaG
MTAQELKSLRDALGLSQQGMADLLKIERVCYTRYENETRLIPSYIEQEVKFFSLLSQRVQQKLMREAREQSLARDAGRGR